MEGRGWLHLNKRAFLSKSSPKKPGLVFQCLTALSLVPIALCFYGLMVWFVGIAMPISECGRVPCWLVGFWTGFRFYLWDMCWRRDIELRNGVYREEPEVQMCVIPRLRKSHWCKQFSWGHGAVMFLGHAAHWPECCSLLLLRQELLHDSLTLRLKNTSLRGF